MMFVTHVCTLHGIQLSDCYWLTGQQMLDSPIMHMYMPIYV